MKANNRSSKLKNIKGFKKEVPKALLDIVRDPDTQRPISIRQMDHVIGNSVYHPTKGWRKVRQYNPHTLLNDLWVGINLQPFYNL
jgi:hypothetical protein